MTTGFFFFFSCLHQPLIIKTKKSVKLLIYIDIRNFGVVDVNYTEAVEPLPVPKKPSSKRPTPWDHKK